MQKVLQDLHQPCNHAGNSTRKTVGFAQMIRISVENPVVRRALVDLLAECDATETPPRGEIPPSPMLIVSDRHQAGQTVPVLVLGGPELPLPIRTTELLARVRQALREQTPELEDLTARENALLTALAAAAPEGVSRESLLQHVWRYDPHAETHTIETHIYRLRQKLEAKSDPRRIVTVAGGYRLD
jgi:DNA-binding response OmpR family regulator